MNLLQYSLKAAKKRTEQAAKSSKDMARQFTFDHNMGNHKILSDIEALASGWTKRSC